MKKDLDRSKASFKLDLIETANADPIITPADLKVLAAYVSVMAWPSGRAWLIESLGRAKTGLSHAQFWASRARLLGNNDEKRAYLIAVRQGGKVSTFKLINPWRDEAIAHVEAMTGYHREVERQRKEAKRVALSLQQMEGRKPVTSLRILDGQIPPCPSDKWSPVPPDNGDKYPSLSTPRKKVGREEGNEASNVVPLDRHRRTAS